MGRAGGPGRAARFVPCHSAPDPYEFGLVRMHNLWLFGGSSYFILVCALFVFRPLTFISMTQGLFFHILAIAFFWFCPWVCFLFFVPHAVLYFRDGLVFLLLFWFVRFVRKINKVYTYTNKVKAISQLFQPTPNECKFSCNYNSEASTTRHK